MRIVIADDHTLFRQGMVKLLSDEKSMHVIGEASNGADAVSLSAELRPDVLIMDISMPGLSGFDACRQIKRTHPHTKVFFLSMYEDEDYLMRALESGGSGYMVKDTPAQQLIAAVTEVANGGTYLSPKLLRHLVDEFRGKVKATSKVPRLSTLTPREGEVLKLLAEGRCVKEVAGDLHVSVKTVEAHKCNLMRKLDVHSNTQLVHYAFQNKIVQVTALASPAA